jgi:hypothetical protein
MLFIEHPFEIILVQGHIRDLLSGSIAYIPTSPTLGAYTPSRDKQKEFAQSVTSSNAAAHRIFQGLPCKH